MWRVIMSFYFEWVVENAWPIIGLIAFLLDALGSNKFEFIVKATPISYSAVMETSGYVVKIDRNCSTWSTAQNRCQKMIALPSITESGLHDVICSFSNPDFKVIHCSPNIWEDRMMMHNWWSMFFKVFCVTAFDFCEGIILKTQTANNSWHK